MFNYRKRLFYPVHVERQDPIFAKVLLEHYAGRDSELSYTNITILRDIDNTSLYQCLLVL
ncbi:fragment of manganese-dependent catalase (part 1/2) [Candidatus Desulfosporosinus infrequens]|uniref:Fragment of manganese-dependent catalase (Part 1/2) n=1 Tax=Candidatus Desulfosporosinus infrequens TaxID=2043169 RepID=A0A2U3LDG5_9FIRM|nr:fragment of manganese-dependent catalase (part 1/2) [Candidatus Desulfosporosinus infrequens]